MINDRQLEAAILTRKPHGVRSMHIGQTEPPIGPAWFSVTFLSEDLPNGGITEVGATLAIARDKADLSLLLARHHAQDLEVCA